MKKIIKSISALLTVVMLIGSFAALFTVNAFAADASSGSPASDAATPQSIDHVTHYFATPEEKIATMSLVLNNGGVELYVDKVSGEVAYVNRNTGETLFTNPYDVAASTGSDATKQEILSQLVVHYTDNKSGQESTFHSFKEASLRNQIAIENIKNGVRIEYTIGRDQSKTLVPRLISMERFEEMILAPLKESFGEDLYASDAKGEFFNVQKMLSYFMIYSVDKLQITDKERKDMKSVYGGLFDDLKSSDSQYAKTLKQYPIIDAMPVVAFDPNASDVELALAESIIVKYCPDYTFEELTYDHLLTEYASADANPPVFRMALEYRIEADGLSVRLPANGIRFNESLYTLNNVEVLPYMGAGNSAYEGYNFFPDGSGSLFDFQDLKLKGGAVEGSVYGSDFAYHKITGKYQKTIRYPVFGIVENTTYYTYTVYDGDTKVSEITLSGNIVDKVKQVKLNDDGTFEKNQWTTLADNLIITGYDNRGNPEGVTYFEVINNENAIETKTEKKQGFVCVIEEGDALASLTTYHAGTLSDYNTVKMAFTPRPKDSYKLTGAISVSGEVPEQTIVSERKYVGNYSMKYITLSETKNSSEAASGKYDASWLGMAVAYRDYLTNNGIISKLTNGDITKDNIPLYIETFGALETTEKIMSIPVDVMSPLTTFENIKTMYDELSANGMKNINFKLTGFANGGMDYTMPGKLKFEKVVGGNDGFEELLAAAAAINGVEGQNMGIYPDFDFAYNKNSGWFDGYSARKHNAQTIDGRYASKRVYSPTQQRYNNYFEMVISPAYFADFYTMLEENYADKYSGTALNISVSTLGNALNSDFDEDEPYNREDSKEFTATAFEHFNNTYANVMTDGGNAYVWKYVDHILDVSLESSRYNFSSDSVPFIGVVLHGSIQFAGEPLNMEGNLDYALLKAIENGASPYFILSFQNTQALKNDELLSQYYSVRYDIWGDDIVDAYNALNGALADVQNKYIIDHKFLENGTRVPDADELMADILAKYEAELETERNAAETLAQLLAQSANIARENGRKAEKYVAEAIVRAIDIYTSQLVLIGTADADLAKYQEALKSYDDLIASGVTSGEEFETIKAQKDALREKAIESIANADKTDADEMKAIFSEAKVYLELAIEAIEILAKSEEAVVTYADDDRTDPGKITNYDELPFIVREAIDKAISVYDIVYSDMFREISDGMPTGEKYTDAEGVEYDVYTTVTSNGNAVFFYGTYETGYKYLVKNGNTYEEDATVYNTDVVVGQTSDGENIYLDGSVYFSVDADGVYTRYTYLSIESCASDVEETLLNTMNDAKTLAAQSSDKTFASDVEERIALFKSMNEEEEEVEDVEEDTEIKYTTESIVAVTYGNDDGTAYKTLILNYNNYTVRIEYNGNIYTIAAHKFVEIKE